MKMLKTTLVLAEVGEERMRQEDLVRQGKFQKTCADPTMDDADRLCVLGEEFGEVCTGLMHRRGYDETGPGDLRTELLQLAAVAVAWVEALTPDPALIEPAMVRG